MSYVSCLMYIRWLLVDIASMKHQMESLRVLRPRISPRPYSDAAAIPAAIPDAVPDAGAVTDSTADSESK